MPTRVAKGELRGRGRYRTGQKERSGPGNEQSGSNCHAWGL